MKYLKIILLSLCFSSCLNNYKTIDRSINYTVSTGNNISINKSEVEAALDTVIRKDPVSRNSIEVVVYGYSSNKEVFSYDGGSTDGSDGIKAEVNPGRMDSLIKIKEGSILQKVLFLHVDGNNKEEILKKFAVEIRRICK